MNRPHVTVPPAASRPTSISVSLVAHFERLIATGELPPGARLPAERELAEELSVSRSSLREAMHELESKHLIDRTPGRGTVVLSPSAGVHEIWAMAAGANQEQHASELRLLIEPAVAGLAAVRATPANILQLQDVLDRSAGRLKQADSLRLDIEFHLLLAQAAQNPLLSALQSMTSEWTAGVRQHSHSTAEGRRMSTRGHQALLDAVTAHDGAAAKKAMEDHLTDVQQTIAKHSGA